MNVPDTFKHLTSWKPLVKVTLPCSDPGGDFAPTKFSISEKQGDKSISKSLKLIKNKIGSIFLGGVLLNFWSIIRFYGIKKNPNLIDLNIK